MRIGILVLTLTAGLIAASTAVAKDREAVRKSGTCSKASTSKIKLSQEDGLIEVEFEVDQNRNRVRWVVVLKQRGRVVFQGTRATRAPSGSFELRRLLPDRSGADAISAKATSPSGEVCRAAATF